MLKLDINTWGILAGVAILFIALGTWVYNHYPKMNIFVVTAFLLISVLTIGTTWLSAVAIFGMMLSHFVRGYFETKLMVDMNSAITKSVRSSVLSLRSLLIRVGAAGFMGGGGLLLKIAPFSYLMVTSVLIFAIIGFYPLLQIRKFEKSLAA